jgi:hypothetical protein
MDNHNDIYQKSFKIIFITSKCFCVDNECVVLGAYVKLKDTIRIGTIISTMHVKDIKSDDGQNLPYVDILLSWVVQMQMIKLGNKYH